MQKHLQKKKPKEENKVKKMGLITAGLFLAFMLACNTENSNNSSNQDKDSVNTPIENTVDENSIDTSSVEKTETNSENAGLDEEYTAKYICPNHDKGSGSDEPGDCPVCGMELIENPNYQGK